MKHTVFRRTIAIFLLFFLTLSAGGAAFASAEDAPEMLDLPVIRIDSEVSAEGSDEYEDARVSLLNTTQEFCFDEMEAEWKIHGRSSAVAAKKPFNLRFRYRVDLLGMGEARKWILLANHYDKTMLRNRLMYDLSGQINMRYPVESRFVELYVNGDYQGLYQLCEAPQIDRERVAIHPSKEEFLLEVLIPGRTTSDPTIRTPHKKIQLGLDSIDYLPPDQEEWLTDFFDRAESALKTGNKEEIAAYFDLDSFVNGYILYEFSKNADLAIGSTRFVIEDGKLYTGAAWDFDLSCGNGIRNCDPLHQVNGTIPCATDGWYAVQLWYRDLVQLDWFQDLFSERYRDLQPILVNLYEANELGTSQIDQLVESMPQAIEHNYQKWRVDGREYASARPPEKTYELNVEYLRTWLKDRNEWILQELDHGRGPKLLY